MKYLCKEIQNYIREYIITNFEDNKFTEEVTKSSLPETPLLSWSWNNFTKFKYYDIKICIISTNLWPDRLMISVINRDDDRDIRQQSIYLKDLKYEKEKINYFLQQTMLNVTIYIMNMENWIRDEIHKSTRY